MEIPAAQVLMNKLSRGTLNVHWKPPTMNVIKVRFLGIFACQRNSFPGKFASFYPIFLQYSPFIPFITGLDLYRTNEISIQH